MNEANDGDSIRTVNNPLFAKSPNPANVNDNINVTGKAAAVDYRAFSIDVENQVSSGFSAELPKGNGNISLVLSAVIPRQTKTPSVISSAPTSSVSFAQSVYPVYLMFVAIVIAWIYTVIPDSNFWVYTCVKQQIWAVFATVVYTEDLDSALPDTPDSVYLASYAVGLVLPLLISISTYLAGAYETGHLYVQVFGTTSGLIGSVVCFGFHACWNPEPTIEHKALRECLSILSDQQQQHKQTTSRGVSGLDTVPERDRESTGLSHPRPAIAVSNYFDLFTASCNARDLHSSSISNSSAFMSGDASIEKDKEDGSSEQSRSQQPIGNHSDFSPSRIRWLTISQQLTSFSSKRTASTSSSDSSLRFLGKAAQWSPNVAASGDPAGRGTFINSVWSRLVDACTLPRYFISERRLFAGTVLVDRRQQWLVAAVFVLLINGYFYFLIFFTNYFRKHAGTDLIKLFLVYVLCTTVLRVILKRLGMILDKGKFGTTSLFFIAEFHALTFYYTFYRILFESIDSWGVFLLFQLLHLGSEWILYPCRCSPTIVPLLERIQKNLSDFTSTTLTCCLSGGATVLSTVLCASCCPELILPPSQVAASSAAIVAFSPLSIFVPRDTDAQDWLAFVALDFGIRVVVMVTCAVGMLLLVLTIDECYWIDNALHQGRHARALSSIYIIISVILELCNAYAMNRIFFVPLKVNVYEKVLNVFNDRRFATISSLTAACLLLIPVYAFTTDNEYPSPHLQ